MIEAIQNHKFVENSIQINQKLFLASPVKFSKYGWEYLFLSTPEMRLEGSCYHTLESFALRKPH